MLYRLLTVFLSFGLCGTVFGQPPSQSVSIEFQEDLLAVDLNSFDQICASSALAENDEDRDGVLSKEEYGKLKLLSEASRFDINRNSRMTLLEIAIYFSNARMATGMSPQCCEQALELLAEYDRNADNSMSEAELKLVACPFKFSELDYNEGGTVGLFELARWLTSEQVEKGIEPIDHVMAIRSVKQYDSDSDKYLSKAEQVRGKWPYDLKRYYGGEDERISSAGIAMLFTDFKQATGVDSISQAAALRVIAKFDQDRDAWLSEKEFKNGRYRPEEWESFDVDEDGAITWYEIAHRYSLNRVERGATLVDIAKAESLLNRYDHNRNGSVDLLEATELKAGIGMLSFDDFADFDSDGNQVLSKVELANFFRSRREQEGKER